jgi:DUF4097 and DUF4098 domain-containing protein YvlB
MNRKDYMEELKSALALVDEDLRAEIIEDYEEHFENGLKYGKTEQQICTELGDIKELVKELGQFDKEVTSKPQVNIILDRELSITPPQPLTKIEDNLKEVLEPYNLNNEKQRDNHEQQRDYNEQQRVNHEQQCRNTEESQERETSQSQDAGASHIIVKALFADVNITRSNNSKIEVNCYHDGDRKQQMIYRFNTWQEGNCIYAEVVRENSNTGFFNFLKTPYMRINITIPENFPSIDVDSASGNIDVTGIVVNHAKFISASGDIEVKVCKINQLIMNSRSGSLNLNKCEGDNLTMDSASGEDELSEVNFRLGRINTSSGDINVNNITGDNFALRNQSGDIEVYDGSVNYLEVHSISGDIQIQRTKAMIIKGQSTSGDVNINDINSEQIEISSTSGDLNGRNLAGMKLYANSKSGDVDIDTNAKDCNAKTLSGCITLNTIGDIKVQAESISGDIDLRINNRGNGYEASVHSVSGDQNLTFGGEDHNFYKSGKYIFGNAGSIVAVKTTSGDIEIRG